MVNVTFTPNGQQNNNAANTVKILSPNMVKQGDTENDFRVQLLKGDLPVDLTGKTVTWSAASNKGKFVTDRAATVEGDGTVGIAFTGDDQGATGSLRVEFKVAYADGDVEKFPAHDYAYFQITRSLDDLAHTPVMYASVQYFESKVAEVITGQQTFEQTVDGKIVELESTVQTGIGAFTEDTEVVLARGGEVNLGARLDKTTAQLADKLSAKQVVTGAQADGQNITFGHETNAIANDVATSVIIGGGTTNNNNIIGGDGTSTIGTPTPNVVSAGTGANVSLVGGYDNVAGSLSSKIISDHSMTEIGGPGHNAIFGGAYGKIKSTTGFGFIAGGQKNELSDGNYSFVTGYDNKVKGQGSAAFGYGHLLNNAANFATGAAHTVAGSFAQAHGSSNKADGNFSKAEGNFSHTRFVSQQSMAGGRFSATGDAQASVMVMHRQTTDATTVNLGVIGSNTSFQLQFNQSVAFTALLVARLHGGTDTAAWEIKGMARRGATGSVTVVGATVTSIGADAGAAAWTVAVAGDSIGGLNVRVTGEAGKIIKWVQRMTLAEVMI